MLFLCSLSLLALLAYRVPHLTAWQAQARVPATGTQLQILIPLYNYPNWYDPNTYIWDDVAAANSQVPITAIINPNSGPGGGAPNADYVTGLGHLRDAGVTIVGYVPTNYGDRLASDVKADVDLYDQHFNIHGIFFDEAASGADKLSYYQDLYAYVKARPNLDKVIINPGVNVSEGYISAPASDTAITFENYSTEWPGYQPSAYMANYSADRFAMLAHGVPDVATMQSHLDRAKACHIAYVYLTDDTLPNPWDTLPSFWSQEVAYIQQLNLGRVYNELGLASTACTVADPDNFLYLPTIIR
ncbi:MAG: spherulation-specific family 4 protein [Ardenticatenaceae bacterium]